MLQQWLEQAPARWGTVGLWIAGVGALAGLVLWLGGARFGRSAVTLAMVSGGAVIGKMLPARMGWTIDPMATGIAGALVVGIAGYLLYRLWAALGLGLLLAIWAAWATWVLSGVGPLSLPALTQETTLASFAGDLWHTVSPRMQFWLPIAGAAAGIIGTALGLLWCRVGEALLFSLLGTSLLILGTLAALHLRWPAALERMPTAHGAQAGIAGALVAVGFSVQYRLAARAMPAARKRAVTEDDDE